MPFTLTRLLLLVGALVHEQFKGHGGVSGKNPVPLSPTPALQEVPRTQQLSQWAGGGRHGGSRGPGGPRHSEELGSCESGQLPGADLEEQGVQGQEGARAWGQSVKRGGGRLRVFPS